jgi:hypothetical protein
MKMNSCVNNQNIINKPPANSCLCCIYCDKRYKTRKNLDKHLVLCEIIYKSKNNKTYNAREEEEEIELPSQKYMYKIILDLAEKYSKLEEKMEQLTKWIDKKKKKINVIEWLNTNINPEFIFDDLFDNIEVSEEDIERLLMTNFMDIICEIVTNNLYKLSQSKSLPIFCFDQKTNYIYVYNIQNIPQSENPSWSPVEREKLISFMNKIHMKITKKLSEWKKTQEIDGTFVDSKAEKYNKTIIKLMDINFKQDNTFNKIKSIIYGSLKTDMKALVEYEFEF